MPLQLSKEFGALNLNPRSIGSEEAQLSEESESQIPTPRGSCGSSKKKRLFMKIDELFA
jgi:hypothetical protein